MCNIKAENLKKKLRWALSSLVDEYYQVFMDFRLSYHTPKQTGQTNNIGSLEIWTVLIQLNSHNKFEKLQCLTCNSLNRCYYFGLRIFKYPIESNTKIHNTTIRKLKSYLTYRVFKRDRMIEVCAKHKVAFRDTKLQAKSLSPKNDRV